MGEKPTIIPYNYIDCYAGTPNKTKKKDTISLNCSLICYIASTIVVADVQLSFMWCGVGKTNHNDEPCIKLVMLVFLRTDSSRTIHLLATASGDKNRPECIGCTRLAGKWYGGVLEQGKRFLELVVHHKFYALSCIHF